MTGIQRFVWVCGSITGFISPSGLLKVSDAITAFPPPYINETLWKLRLRWRRGGACLMACAKETQRSSLLGEQRQIFAQFQKSRLSGTFTSTKIRINRWLKPEHLFYRDFSRFLEFLTGSTHPP